MRWSPLPVLALLLAALLAGCTGKGPEAPAPLPAEAQTGSLRGVVVDAAITPVVGAQVALAGGGAATVTDKAGLFTFQRLAPGDHFFTVSKPGYTTVQSFATVQAGDATPPLVRVQVQAIPSQRPYVETFKLRGFYECAVSFGVPGVTPVMADRCDMGSRIAYDAYNETAGSPPPGVPREALQGSNTQFLDVPADTLAIVQEAFWTDETVPALMVLLGSTPIDTSCDCSNVNYLDVTQGNPTHARLDRPADGGLVDATDSGAEAVKAQFPQGRYASRAFLDWNSPSQATDFEFTVLTTLFHNYHPAEGWTFETQDRYPVG